MVKCTYSMVCGSDTTEVPPKSATLEAIKKYLDLDEESSNNDRATALLLDCNLEREKAPFSIVRIPESYQLATRTA
jgi:hypothetical protein